MPDWACTRCGEVNLEGQRMCEGCGAENRGTTKGPHVAKARPLQAGAPPCTLEQSKAANAVLQMVLEGRITAAEGRRRQAKLFGMPELEHET